MNAIGSITSLAIAFAITGCATPPSEADIFSTAAVPAPAKDEVVLVIFRQVTPPTLWRLTVQVNDSWKAELPTNAYAVTKVNPGPAVFTLTYPRIAFIEPTRVEKSFEGGSTHYLETTPYPDTMRGEGLIEQMVIHGLQELRPGLVEWTRRLAVRQLTQCCRRVGPVPQ